MIEITLYQDLGGRLSAITVLGHAGFSDSEHGGDIVCSAVSGLVGYLGIVFADFLPHCGAVGADDGMFELDIKEAHRQDRELTVLLQAWCSAVRQLEENYRGWVKVEEKFKSLETT